MSSHHTPAPDHAPDQGSAPTGRGAGAGWTHEEAKKHTLVERLWERCAVYGGKPCAAKPELAHDDWCERCLAAEVLVSVASVITAPEVRIV